MKKLNALKTIVDVVWIISLIGVPFIFICSVITFINPEIVKIPIKILNNNVDIKTITGKTTVFVGFICMGLYVYGLYLFRKLLSCFQTKLIFEESTIIILKKLGNVFIISSLIYSLTLFLISFSNNKATIIIGDGPFLYLLMIGLFLIVLSEVFEMGKKIKEDNELTI